MERTQLDPRQTVADLVLDHSECAEVLARHRIDFCCRGDLSIEAAARARGVDPEALVEELTRAISSRPGAQPEDPRELSTQQLVSHIVSIHHAYLRKALPFIRKLAAKVGRVHGERNPALRQLAELVAELEDALTAHLDEEERVLFPALIVPDLDRRAAAELLREMEEDHYAVAALLEDVRAAAGDYVPPAWACNSYRTLLSELARLESDTHRHVHLENHVLMPRFVPLGPLRF
jgi:regulator of cell morphogenesis and NO signaling